MGPDMRCEEKRGTTLRCGGAHRPLAGVSRHTNRFWGPIRVRAVPPPPIPREGEGVGGGGVRPGMRQSLTELCESVRGGPPTGPRYASSESG